jgi:hypothetical protein
MPTLSTQAIITKARQQLQDIAATIAKCRSDSPPRHGYECFKDGDELTEPCEICGSPDDLCALCNERQKDADTIALLADALEAAHRETSTETALQCPICHGTGTLSPDDSERVIQSSGELFNAGYDAGKRAALKESPSGD